jgi:small-conductance mechanosensitive channel
MANLTATIQQTLGTNAATAEILVSLFLFVGVAVIGWAIYFVFNRYFSKWAQKTETTLDDDILDAVKSFIVISIAIIGIEFALSPLSFLQPHAETMQKIILAVEIFFLHSPPPEYQTY